MQDVINQYFNRSDSLQKQLKSKPKYSPQQFTFDVRLVKTPLVTQFAPDLKQLDPVIINGYFNSQTGDLVVNGSMPKVVYGTNEINNVKLAINTPTTGCAELQPDR